MRLATPPLLLALATACAAAPPADGNAAPAEAESAVACDAAAAQALVGRASSDALGAEALRLSGAATLRWIEPDSMVTMEYRADRLNIGEHIAVLDALAEECAEELGVVVVFAVFLFES